MARAIPFVDMTTPGGEWTVPTSASLGTAYDHASAARSMSDSHLARKRTGYTLHNTRSGASEHEPDQPCMLTALTARMEEAAIKLTYIQALEMLYKTLQA